MSDAVFPAAELACRDFEERAAGLFGRELWVGLGECNIFEKEREKRCLPAVSVLPEPGVPCRRMIKPLPFACASLRAFSG